MNSDSLTGPPRTRGGTIAESLNPVQTETGRRVERGDSLTAGERRGCLATENPAADEDLHFVCQALSEKGPDDRTPSFHQDRLHVSCRETIEEGLQIHLVLAETHDLGTRERTTAFLRRDDQRRGAPVQDVGRIRNLAVGVQDHPEWIPPLRVFRLHGQLRIVLQNCTDPYEDRIFGRSKAMHAAEIFFVAQSNALAIGERDLSIDTHRGVDDHARSHGHPMGRPNNNFAGSERSSSSAPTCEERRQK